MSASLSHERLGEFVAKKYGGMRNGGKVLGKLTKSSHHTGSAYIQRTRNLGLPAALELALADPEFKAVLIGILNGENEL